MLLPATAGRAGLLSAVDAAGDGTSPTTVATSASAAPISVRDTRFEWKQRAPAPAAICMRVRYPIYDGWMTIAVIIDISAGQVGCRLDRC
uniref:Unannotated protein n=1 Tax=freshwater metagenome TaxID=449393 RepID=A0A6J7PHW5_9ZZZZ